MPDKICTDLNLWIAKIHTNAVKHGWWEKDRTFGEIIALVHSELSEALEEYRKFGEDKDKMIYYSCTRNNNIAWECDGNCKGCQYGKPEGIAIELADTVIRILDYFGSENETFNMRQQMYADEDVFDFSTFGDFITECHAKLSGANWSSHCEGKHIRSRFCGLIDCMEQIFSYLREQGLDPYEVIAIKCAYNETRPYRHGGKKL